MKKIKYDLIISILCIFTSILPIIVSEAIVQAAKASGNYYGGSGHDVGLLLAIFLTMTIGGYHGITILLSAFNDFLNKNIQKQNLFAIILTVCNVLGVLGNILITFLIYSPLSPLNG